MQDVNPVGQPVQLTAMDAKVNELIVKWETENPLPEGWFSKFKTKAKTRYTKVTRFLIESLDELIIVVENLLDLGPDKKATVLLAIGTIYDAIIAKSLPVWLRPFNMMIRAFVISVVISTTIDFIVSKYSSGNWSKNTENPVIS